MEQGLIDYLKKHGHGSAVIIIAALLLLVFLLMPQAASAAAPQQHKDFPQGVSAVNPGSESWNGVRQRGEQVEGITRPQFASVHE